MQNLFRMRSHLTRISVCVIVIYALSLEGSFSANTPASRIFSVQINPGCETAFPSDCGKNVNRSLIHIRSDGEEDSLHFIWSFLGAPSLLLVRTPLQANLTIDWVSIFLGSGSADSIKFEPPPSYVFGWSLVKVWVYNDRDDLVRLDKVNQSQVVGYDSKNFEWIRQDNASIINSTMISLPIEARYYDHEDGERFADIGPNGFFKFTIRMKNTEDYSSVLPYMMYNENSTQIDIAFNDVQLNNSAAEYPSHPRIAFKYVLVQDNGSPGQAVQKMKLDVTKTLDDEHSPGVFEVYNVKTPAKGFSESYMQWKPICYTTEVRAVIDSIDVVAYPLHNTSVVFDDNIQDSILWSYFGDQIGNLTLDAMNISFGTRGDGFYNKTKHISWTYSTGFGTPASDRVSLLVMLVVSIGLGIPAVIIVFSVIYMVLCQVKRPRDDLLLGQ